MIDECTTKKLRVLYARVLIGVDVTTELKDYMNIRYPKGNKVLQKVEYEWKPLYCKTCNKVGHKCKKKRIQQPKKQLVWKAKQNEKEEEKNIQFEVSNTQKNQQEVHEPQNA